MTNVEIRKALEELKSSDRYYKDFTFLVEPAPFNKLFRDEKFDLVRVNLIQYIPVGITGRFAWADGIISTLNGDSYDEKALVWGYDKFVLSDEAAETYGGKDGLEILVTDF